MDATASHYFLGNIIYSQYFLMQRQSSTTVPLPFFSSASLSSNFLKNHKTNHFKVYNSAALNMFTKLCNQYHFQTLEHLSPKKEFHKKKSCLQPLKSINLLSAGMKLLILDILVDELIQYVTYCDQFLSLINSITFSRFIFIVVCISTSFTFMA